MKDQRQCSKCGETRPITMFYVEIEERRAQREGRKSFKMHCRLCQREQMSRRLAPRRQHVDQVKLSAGCADCGIRSPHPEIYDFDHVRGEKKHSVSSLITKGSMEDLLSEIAKCDVVCANCHRIRTKSREPGHFGRARG